MSALAGAVAATNHVRWQPSATAAAKEWFHFCVVAPGVQALCNLSLGGPSGDGRVLVLARVDDERSWRGGQTIGAASASGHRVTVGAATMAFHAGRYLVNARATGPGAADDVEVDLELVPLTVPLVAEGVDLAPGSLGWVALPRLVARGVIRAGGRSFRLEHALAYHDHNWGEWRWGGGDFAWQWGFALDEREGGASILYSRLTDRARGRAFDTKLSVWNGELLARVFAGGDVRVDAAGQAPAGGLRRVPAVMRLVVAGEGVEAPARLDVTAGRGDDWLALRFRPEALVQVAIPNEVDYGFTLIDETSGRFEVKGRIDGVDLGFAGRSLFEFVSFE